MAMRKICLAMAISTLMACSSESESEASLEATKQKILNELTRDLYDPASATLRDVILKVSENGKVVTMCGEINGKNRLGAYAGYRKFHASFFTEEDRVSMAEIEPSTTGPLAKPDKMVFDLGYELSCEDSKA
jgi:hypothetical protein